MSEQATITVVVEDLQRALLAMKRDILDCEPVAALNRIDALLDKLEPNPWCNHGAHLGTKRH